MATAFCFAIIDGMAKRSRIKAFFLFCISGALVLGGAFFVWAATLKLPDVESFSDRKITQSTKIYDRTGEVLLYDLHRDTNRTIVPIGDISRNIQNATIAIEDDRFYDHFGVRPLATLRAVFIQPLRGRGVQGGSTITQQVVKNSILTTDRDVSRKLKEWVLAVRLEGVLSKEEILELYLNETPYGGTIYGVEEASKAFFGKSAHEVSIAEAAYLAALPQAPTFLSPYGNNRDALETRKNVVLVRMRDLDFITEEEYRAAMREEVEFRSQAISGIRAPHFVFYVREQLEREYGARAIEEAGWRIITTLDIELQEAAERIVAEYAMKNKDDFDAENAGLVAVDPHTGDILAMVGSRNYFDPDIDGNFNITLAKRQPGSAFKPFVYAEAIRKGYTPETILFDVPTQFSTACAPDSRSNTGDCYAPNNYDLEFRGPMTMRDALAQSVNVPAVKALYLVGLTDAIRLARALGITTLENGDRYGLTLVLGGGEVRLLDMVSAYGVFAAEGVRNPHRAALRIEDREGRTIRAYAASPNRVLDAHTANTVSDMLADNTARTPAFGANSPLHFEGRHVAAKTGTTNDSRDAWIIGYTPYIAVGAWAGNNDNRPMVKSVAGFIIAPLWREFMTLAMARYPNTPFPEARTSITEHDKPVLRGIWTGEGNEFSVHSILYWVDKNNPRGPRPENPERDSQFPLWEYAVLKWAHEAGLLQ